MQPSNNHRRLQLLKEGVITITLLDTLAELEKHQSYKRELKLAGNKFVNQLTKSEANYYKALGVIGAKEQAELYDELLSMSKFQIDILETMMSVDSDNKRIYLERDIMEVLKKYNLTL